MLKEEILQTELDKINKGNTSQIQFCYQAIFNAMDIFSNSKNYSKDSEEYVTAKEDWNKFLKSYKDIRPDLIKFLKWHDAKFGSESSDVIIAEMVDEYLTQTK